jgi:hypothetical protein
MMLVFGPFAMTGGCETFTPPTQDKTIIANHAVMIDTIATRRGTYLVYREDGAKSRWVLVAEPPPDAALASAVKAAAEVAAKTAAGVDVSGKGSIEVTQQLTKLVERTQAVTIARDAMYRLSEAYANKTIDEATYNTQFTEVLKVVSSLAAAAEQAAKKDAANAQTKLKILSNPTLNEDQKMRQLQAIEYST